MVTVVTVSHEHRLPGRAHFFHPIAVYRQPRKNAGFILEQIENMGSQHLGLPGKAIVCARIMNL